jgi:tRNA pseudouridine38-40 synthase
VFAAETHAHVAQQLDVARMHEAAQALVGTRDFKVFTVTDPETQTTVRTITSVEVTREAERVVITASADGFLRYMVRRIAGSLLEVGRGKLAPDALFAEARWTAPAKGLVLRDVRYQFE